MRLTDAHGIDWIREPNGSWRMARPDEVEFLDDPEGYMHGWYHGAMCMGVVFLLALIAIGWILTYRSCG